MNKFKLGLIACVFLSGQTAFGGGNNSRMGREGDVTQEGDVSVRVPLVLRTEQQSMTITPQKAKELTEYLNLTSDLKSEKVEYWTKCYQKNYPDYEEEEISKLANCTVNELSRLAGIAATQSKAWHEKIPGLAKYTGAALTGGALVGAAWGLTWYFGSEAEASPVTPTSLENVTTFTTPTTLSTEGWNTTSETSTTPYFLSSSTDGITEVTTQIVQNMTSSILKVAPQIGECFEIGTSYGMQCANRVIDCGDYEGISSSFSSAFRANQTCHAELLKLNDMLSRNQENFNETREALEITRNALSQTLSLEDTRTLLKIVRQFPGVLWNVVKNPSPVVTQTVDRFSQALGFCNQISLGKTDKLFECAKGVGSWFERITNATKTH